MHNVKEVKELVSNIEQCLNKVYKKVEAPCEHIKQDWLGNWIFSEVPTKNVCVGRVQIAYNVSATNWKVCPICKTEIPTQIY